MNTFEESINDLFISDEETYELELYRQITKEYEFIYKIEFYENDMVINHMYYHNENDVKWVFNSNQNFNVFYIKVPITSKEYLSAFHNSKILDDFTSSKIIKKKVKNSKII